jgi:hypothetical protein
MFERFAAAVVVTASIAVAAPAAAQATSRRAHPLTVAGVANGWLPSAGVDVAYQLSADLALALQLASFSGHHDLSARSRWFLGPDTGLYLGGNVHGWYSWRVDGRVTMALSFEAGYEGRTDGGWTWGLGVGAVMVRMPETSLGTVHTTKWVALPLVSLRVGRSW